MSGGSCRRVMPQSLCCMMIRSMTGAAYPTRSGKPAKQGELASTSGVTRPPTLRMTAASPVSRPSTCAGSTRGSTQPSTSVRSRGSIGSPGANRVRANSSLRSARVSTTVMLVPSELLTNVFVSHLHAAC